MELTKAELESILTQVTKEYDEVVKSEKALMEKSVLPMNKEETTEGSGEKSKPETTKAQDPMPEGSKEKSAALFEKAEGDDSGPPKEEKPKSETPDSKPSDSEAPADDSAPPQEAAPEVPAEQPAPEMAPAEGEMVSDDSMGSDQLLELYSGLSPEHLAQHWMAASQALFQSMSAEQVDPMAGGQPPPPMDQPPAPPTEGMPPMAKSEKEFEALQKNFNELKAQNEGLEKKLEEVTDVLAKRLGMPVQNGVTADTAISKSETEVAEKPITKSEVVQLLKVKATEAKLSESDKSKIVKYTMNPEVTQELKTFLGLK